MSVGVAHADPGASLGESQVRAGDPVHFTITNGDGHVSYEIEVGGRDVLKGSGEGPTVSGQFTMPDFGASAKSVKVEIDIEDDDDKTEVARKLQYLGAALPPPAPVAVPQLAPAAPQQTAAAPASSPAPATSPGPATKATHRAKSKPRKHARKRRTARRKSKRSTAVADRRSKPQRSKPAKARKRVRRPAPRTAPLFDGVPERGASRYRAEEEDITAPRKKVPTSPVFGTVAAQTSGGEPAIAILVPGLLGLAGFLLAAATVVRRRRSR